MWRETALCVVLSLLVAEARAIEKEDVGSRRLAHLLGYIAADYPNAVRDGVVVDRFEHEEQLALLDTSSRLAEETGATEIVTSLRALRVSVERRASVDGVVTEAKRLRRGVIGRARIAIFPSAPPDLERGRRLYMQHCTKCHGASGRADTLEAARLKPPPVSFTDPTVVEALSPLRVADTVRFGIDGTAMVPFDFLTPEERWDVAFFVVTLRHTPRPAPHTPRLSLPELATRTDGEILDELYAAGAGARELAGLLAQLRLRPAAPVRGRMRGLVATRDALTRVDLSVARGDREQAQRLAAHAHASELRPVLPLIATVDAAVARELDERLLLLRTRIATNDPNALHRDVAVLRRLCTRAQLAVSRFGADPGLSAEKGLAGVVRDAPAPASLGRAARLLFGGSLRALMWPSACWLVALALARQRERRRCAVTGALGIVLGATIAASGSSLVTAALGVAMLACAAAVIAAAAGRHRAHAVALSCAGAGLLIGHVTTTLGQEGLIHSTRGATLLGVGGAFALAAFVAIEGARLARRANPAVAIAAAGVVAIALAGRAVMTLQAADIVPAHALDFVGVPLLGVHPSVEVLAIQIMLAMLAAWTLYAQLQRADARAADA